MAKKRKRRSDSPLSDFMNAKPTPREAAGDRKFVRTVKQERARIKAKTSAPVVIARNKKGQLAERKQPKLKLADRKTETGGLAGTGIGNDIVGGLGRAAKVGGRFTKDIVTLPITVAQGTYEIGAAAVEAAQGDTKRSKKLYEGLKNHDPIALAVQGRFKEAGKEISNHPGLFAVEVAGLKGTTGRAVTKGQEKVGGKTPTKRESAKDPATNFEVKRTYSRDAFNRPVQRRLEQRRITEAEAKRAEADRLEHSGSNKERIRELRHEANKQDPRVITGGRVSGSGMIGSPAKTAAARAHDVNKIISERHGSRVDKAVTAAMRSGGIKPSAAVTLHAQRITDGSTESLMAYRERIQEANNSGKLEAAELEANRKALRDIDAAIKAGDDPAKVRAASKAVEDVMRPLQQRLMDEGILAKDRGRKAPLVGYAVTQMEGVRPGKSGPVRDVPTATGGTKTVKVKHDEIIAHMTERGIAPGIYLSNKAPIKAGGPGGQSRASRITGQKRTGRGIAIGTADVSADVIRRTALTQQRLVDHADGYRAKLRQFGAGEKLSRDKAVALARNMEAKHGVEYVAVPRMPFAGDKDVAAMAAHGIDMDDAASLRTINESIDQALQGHGPADGQYDIMPKAAADELRAQAVADLPKGAISNSFKAARVNFSRNVLSTSPSWITGNAVEGYVRSIFAGVRPGDAKQFREVVKAVREVDTRLADELEAYGAGAGHHGSTGRLEHGRFLAQYEGSAVAPLARPFARMWERPGPKAVSAGWKAYTDFMFNTLSGRLESAYQSSMSGAYIRKSGLMDPRLRELNDSAIDQAARGLINTPEQAALGNALGEMFGRYSGRTADARWHITTYTPFANWALNALDFTYRVLPRDHPTVTAMTAAADNALRDMYENDALPDWLKGSIALSNGGHLRISRYLPFGAFTSPTDTLSNLLVPQFASSWKALNGQDWKDKKLYDKNGDPIGEGDKTKLAIQAFLEGQVPFMGKVKQIAQKGVVDGIVKSTVGLIDAKPAASSGGSDSGATGDGLFLDEEGPEDDLFLDEEDGMGDDLYLDE